MRDRGSDRLNDNRYSNPKSFVRNLEIIGQIEFATRQTLVHLRGLNEITQGRRVKVCIAKPLRRARLSDSLCMWRAISLSPGLNKI
ncbi:hypothetical protein JYQ62_36680 [Nostoc sp. UHCC 0702]|nr:hypothetical protein JYQ62_36680 [Nostoc sp. UHCC 0702]